jgi:hypothetical protein
MFNKHPELMAGGGSEKGKGDRFSQASLAPRICGLVCWVRGRGRGWGHGEDCNGIFVTVVPSTWIGFISNILTAYEIGDL